MPIHSHVGPEWQHTIDEFPVREGRILITRFTRGTAAISIDMASMSAPRSDTFDVRVDYRGPEPR